MTNSNKPFGSGEVLHSNEVPVTSEVLTEQEDPVDKALDVIFDTEDYIAKSQNLAPGSPELVAEADQALLYVAEETKKGNTEAQPELAYETVVVEGALEAAGLKTSTSENPIVTLERTGHDTDLTEVVAHLHATHAELPNHIEAATIVAAEVERLHAHISETEESGGCGVSVCRANDKSRRARSARYAGEA